MKAKNAHQYTFAGIYSPGDQYVDWISFDGYSTLDDAGNPLTFDGIFQSDIQTAETSHGTIPIMIGETGACNNYLTHNRLIGVQTI